MSDRIVIVGHGHATQAALGQILKHKKNNEVIIISDEPLSGYQKPPLSKEYLTSQIDIRNLYFKSRDFYEKKGLTVIPATKIKQLNSHNRILISESGHSYEFDKLIIATGVKPKRLASTCTGLHQLTELNSIADAQKLKETSTNIKNLCIIGAGFIGLEVACSLSSIIPNITIIEQEDRILKRTNHKLIADVLKKNILSKGVAILNGASVQEIADNKKGFLVTTTQRSVIADSILVAIGSAPNIDWLNGSGINLNNGIIVNNRCETNIEGIYAAGDCVSYANPFNGSICRTTAISHAQHQGKIAGDNIFKVDNEFSELPWFWSNQGDMRLQMIGYPELATSCIINQKENEKITITHLMGDHIVGVESLNDPLSYAQAKKLMGNNKKITKAEAVWL